MEIVLLERVEKLGLIGDIVRVKPGYARNYLLPRKKALRATPENIKVFESRKAQLEADNIKRRSEAEAIQMRMSGLKTVLIRQAGETGQLYGSVGSRDVALAVTEAGFSIDRGQVELAKPVKVLGLYDVRISLHPDVHVMVTVNVARTEEEAQMQFERGGAINRAALMAEEDAAADASIRQVQQVAQKEAEEAELGFPSEDSTVAQSPSA